MTDDELKLILESENLDSETEQLRINAKICTQKHNFLVKAIWTLIPLFLCVFAMFFTAIFLIV